MKNVLKNIFRKTKKEIDSSELDNTAQENLLDKESLDVDMEAWHTHTNDLIKQSATVLYQMIDSEDWNVMFLHGVPTEESAKMQTPSSITITVTNEGKVEVNFGYDEGVSDTDSYFEAYEMNKFTHLIK